MRFGISTLRHQLAAATLVGFVLVLGTAALNFYAVQTAHSAVTTAARSYSRIAIYTRIASAAAELDDNVFRAASGHAPDVQARKVTAARLQGLLSELQRLRFDGGADVARVRIVGEGAEGMRLLISVDRLTTTLEEIERERGGAAARAEIARLRVPYDLFRHDLAAEIVKADSEVGAQSRRVQSLDASLIPRAFLVLGIAAVATAITMLLLLARLKRGLDALEEGTKAVSSGALDHRIRLGGGDELARLAASFDAMAEEVSTKRSALQTVNAGLEAAVASRTRELSRANAALASEDRSRRRFMADVGHELRTPLTIIRGEAQLALRAVDNGGVEPAPIFDRILDQTHALERLVNDMFLIARAESNGLKLHRQPIDLGHLVRKVAADFEALAIEGLAVIQAKATRPVLADVDPDRVNQMLSALIDNALRHTQPGVTVEVMADLEDGHPVLRVCDDGPGVPAEDAEILFSRFHRGETTSQGSGLGLAVVRALAEAHGGAAEIEQVLGGGFCMKLQFPPAKAPVAREKVEA